MDEFVYGAYVIDCEKKFVPGNEFLKISDFSAKSSLQPSIQIKIKFFFIEPFFSNIIIQFLLKDNILI